MPITRGALREVCSGPNAAQEGILADRQQEPPGERLRGTSAKCKAEVPDQALEARRTPSMGASDGGRKPLRESPRGATCGATAKATHPQHQFDRATVGRKIRQPAPIPAVNMPRERTAARTGRRGLSGTRLDPDPVPGKLDPISFQARRQKVSSSKP